MRPEEGRGRPGSGSSTWCGDWSPMAWSCPRTPPRRYPTACGGRCARVGRYAWAAVVTVWEPCPARPGTGCCRRHVRYQGTGIRPALVVLLATSPSSLRSGWGSVQCRSESWGLGGACDRSGWGSVQCRSESRALGARRLDRAAPPRQFLICLVDPWCKSAPPIEYFLPQPSLAPYSLQDWTPPRPGQGTSARVGLIAFIPGPLYSLQDWTPPRPGQGLLERWRPARVWVRGPSLSASGGRG
jgi:hypothetical protein